MINRFKAVLEGSVRFWSFGEKGKLDSFLFCEGGKHEILFFWSRTEVYMR